MGERSGRSDGVSSCRAVLVAAGSGWQKQMQLQATHSNGSARTLHCTALHGHCTTRGLHTTNRETEPTHTQTTSDRNHGQINTAPKETSRSCRIQCQIRSSESNMMLGASVELVTLIDWAYLQGVKKYGLQKLLCLAQPVFSCPKTGVNHPPCHYLIGINSCIRHLTCCRCSCVCLIDISTLVATFPRRRNSFSGRLHHPRLTLPADLAAPTLCPAIAILVLLPKFHRAARSITLAGSLADADAVDGRFGARQQQQQAASGFGLVDGGSSAGRHLFPCSCPCPRPRARKQSTELASAGRGNE